MAREKEKVLRAVGDEPFRLKARRKARKLKQEFEEEEDLTDSLFGEQEDDDDDKGERTGFEDSGLQDALTGR